MAINSVCRLHVRIFITLLKDTEPYARNGGLHLFVGVFVRVLYRSHLLQDQPEQPQDSELYPIADPEFHHRHNDRTIYWR